MHAYLWCFSVLFKIVRPISGESSTKLPIWGHHTQIHRSYGIKRWNTTRKKNSFLVPPIPPWSRWSSDSGKLRGTKNKWIFNFTRNIYFEAPRSLLVYSTVLSCTAVPGRVVLTLFLGDYKNFVIFYDVFYYILW